MSIVITGSTGKLGTQIVQHLSKLIPPSSITATTRNSNSTKAQSLSSPDLGIRLVQADFTDPTSLVEAFKGSERALIISVDKIGEEAFLQHKAAIDAAKRCGVKKVYYTSHLGSKERSEFQPMMDHWRTEQYLEETCHSGSGTGTTTMEFTSLRNGFYMSSMKQMIGSPQHNGKIICPADGKVSWTTHSDLGEGIAKILVSDSDSHSDSTKSTSTPRYVRLTNTSSWDMEDVARILTPILGRTVEREVISEEQHKEKLMGFGVPEIFADMLLTGFRSFRKGEFGETDGYLRDVLGRECESVEVFMKREFTGKEGASMVSGH